MTITVPDRVLESLDTLQEYVNACEHNARTSVTQMNVTTTGYSKLWGMLIGMFGHIPMTGKNHNLFVMGVPVCKIGR